jgi:hypothetical protein
MSTTSTAVEQQDIVFQQYKLAVEMATGLSARRQAANNFFIGLVSGFGALYSLLDKSGRSTSQPTGDPVLLILPICLCIVWWLTIRSYRRINKTKWYVIYKLEEQLPKSPFKCEDEKLGKKRFMLTKYEQAIPLLVGSVFLLSALYHFLTGK